MMFERADTAEAIGLNWSRLRSTRAILDPKNEEPLNSLEDIIASIDMSQK